MKYRMILLASLFILLSVSGVVLAADRPTAATPAMTRHSPVLQQGDMTPPDTVLTVGTPQYTADEILWVSPNTQHTLTAIDNVDPPTAVQTRVRFYRVAAAGPPPAFRVYDGPFNLRGYDGRYRLEFFSHDTAGNVEEINFQIEHLDSASPITTWTLGTPVYVDGFGRPWITNETLHTLEADDALASDGSPGAGLREIRFRITGAPIAPAAEFVVYETPFVIDGPDREYEIDFFATDNIGNRGQTQTVQAFLDTTPPAVDIGGPYVGDEGSLLMFDASGTVDAGSGLAEIAWDLNGDGEFDDATGAAATQMFGDNGSVVVGILAVDNLGHSDIAAASVEVRNVNPAVSITSISTTQPYLGEVVTVLGSFTDPGWLDAHTAVVDWGDGQTTGATVSEQNQAPQATGTFFAQHQYLTVGAFSITVTVTDDDGGTGTASTQAEVGLSPQMPGTLIATDELSFFRLTSTTADTWSSAEWQWRNGVGKSEYWWIGQGQGWLFLFPKTSNDAPYFDPFQSTQAWSNYLTIAVPQEDFQRWFWCGIYLYDEHNRTIGIGCHPEWGPPPDGAGILHPWVAERVIESQSHIPSIIEGTFQTPLP
ncbi:MAG: hypothetical protein ACE5LU_24035 [Anaerolineae bacterium]